MSAMTGITAARLITIAACAALLAVPLTSVGAAPTSATPSTPGRAVDAHAPSVRSEFGMPGPLKVRTNYATTKCSDSLMGLILGLQAHAEGIHEELTCSLAFPYGPDSPVGVQIFAPVGKNATGPYPPVIFMPGIGGNAAMYSALARNWASHGFVVAIPFTFWNSLIEVPTLGTAVLAHFNGDPSNPLFHKVDFSRVTYAGHSAGGQGALQAASVFPQAGRAINPQFGVASVMAIQNGPLAIGATVHVPALVLGGRNDGIVPPWAWQSAYQFNGMQTAPAYFAVARNAHHLDAVRLAKTNPFIGITTAWLRYVAYRDPDAAAFFVGKRWLLPRDKAFDEVRRNSIAARLPAVVAPTGPVDDR